MNESSYFVATAGLALGIWFAIGIRRTVRWRRGFSNVGLDGVRIWLNRLIAVRDGDAYLIFEEMSPPKRFVQFRRDVTDVGATLICHFPNAPWSIEYVPALKGILANENIPFSEAPGRLNEPVKGFVTIENLDDSAAARLVDIIFRQVFGCDSVSVRVLGQGVRREPST